MKTIKFYVSTDPAHYGSEATPQDVQEYATFAHRYLLGQGYEEVEIEFVPEYASGGQDAQAGLRKQVWSAFRPG